MKNQSSPINDTSIPTETKCRQDSVFVRFTDKDIENLSQYADDMGYLLEPEQNSSNHPPRFKVISKANPSLYGWISKVMVRVNEEWQEKFIYGFYRNGAYFHKYPVTYMINSRQMRGIMKRNAIKDPRLATYFRTVFGILDLEPPAHPLDFIFSWLYGCKFTQI